VVKIEFGIREKVILIPGLIALGIFLFSLVFFINELGIVGNSFIIAMFIAVIPYFIYKYSRYAWMKSVERQFPNFIRDLADSKRSGMTLESAIEMAARTNYGKLTPEIKTMSNKLSWGVPFMRVLEIFERQVKSSAAITEVLGIIKEAYKSGGNVVATLDSAAKNMNMLKEAEEERRGVTSQHVMITYAIFFIFLVIVIMIIYILVPMMATSGIGQAEPTTEGMDFGGFKTPCPAETNMIFPCGLFFMTCEMLGVNPGGMSCYYVSLFFYVLVIQGICSGLIAGQLGENSVVAGVRHSIIMTSIALFTIIFFSRMGLFPG